MSDGLQAYIDRFLVLPPAQQQAALEEAERIKELTIPGARWVPNPGPQTEAFDCEADELLFGGEAGGGKTDLGIGLAITCHTRSLLLRRINKDAVKLQPRMEQILGSKDGWNGQDKVWRLGPRRVWISGCEFEDDKQRFKGDAHDLKYFDELSDFTESQYTFIIGWNRSTNPKQRCRVVAGSNPPQTAAGLWMLRRWGPWLDPKHENPAKPGELRWYTTIDGVDTEMDGPGPWEIPGEAEPVLARSRTFIPSELQHNYDLWKSGYGSVLAGMSGIDRQTYKAGDFTVALRDDPQQCIPTDWIRQAQQRWTREIPRGIPMCAIAIDPGGGGDDDVVLAPRYGGWFAPLIVAAGKQAPGGNEQAGLVIQHRRGKATVVIDMGGGYGGGVATVLKENIEDDLIKFHKGSEKSSARTADRALGFGNKRAEVYWRFREALDPQQPGGSQIMLPDDPVLLADLTAPHFTAERQGIVLEPKVDVVDRLGRSPDRGDAVVMAWSQGPKMADSFRFWHTNADSAEQGFRAGRNGGRVVLGHDSARRRGR